MTSTLFDDNGRARTFLTGLGAKVTQKQLLTCIKEIDHDGLPNLGIGTCNEAMDKY